MSDAETVAWCVPGDDAVARIAVLVRHIKWFVAVPVYTGGGDEGNGTGRQRFGQRNPRGRTVVMESLALQPPPCQAGKAAKEKSEEAVSPTVQLHRHSAMWTILTPASHRTIYAPTGSKGSRRCFFLIAEEPRPPLYALGYLHVPHLMFGQFFPGDYPASGAPSRSPVQR